MIKSFAMDLGKRIRGLFTGNGFSAKVFHLIAIFWTGLLFHYALELTGYNLPGVYEYVTIYKEFLLKNLLRLVVGFAAIWIAGKLYDKVLSRIPAWVLLLIACVISGVVSVLWVYLSKTEPVGDQLMVLGCASEYTRGSRFMLNQGAYMTIYAQNFGLMTLERPFVRLFGVNEFIQFQYMVALMVPVGVLSGYHVTGYLSEHSRKAQFYYLLFMITCFPLYGYVPFVYGDVLSIVAFLGTAWCLLSAFENPKVYKIILLGVLAGLSVQLRANTLVLMIGLIIVIVVRLIRGRDRLKTSMLGVSLVGGIVLFSVAIRAMYPFAEGAASIPAITYVYMGMNDDNGNPGWYNSSGLFIFAEYDYDVEATKEACVEAMKPYIENFRNNHAYFADFVQRKIVMQWEVPMLQCLEMTGQKWYAPMGKFASDIYACRGVGELIQKYAKCFQLLVYGGIFALLVKERKRRWEIEKYALLIGSFGGFLFSLIWEAKPRYVLSYFVVLIPYLAIACKEFSETVKEKAKEEQ